MNEGISITLGLILIIGTIFSYSFQYYKIYINSSVNGININTLSMGCLSALFTMYASILLNLDKMSIFTIGLDVSQLILICGCWYTWLMFYMYYIRRQNNESFSFYNRLIAEEDVVIDHQRTNYNFIFWSFCFCWIMLICIGTICIIIPHSQKLINIMYIFASILSILQWFPQVIETYCSSIRSTLAIETLILNSVGCVLTIIYQCVLNGEKVLLMIPYITGAILQIIIVFILKFKTVQPALNLERYDILDNDLQIL